MKKNKLRGLLISTDTTVKQAIQKLNETAEKILFVKDADMCILGTISDGDIRRGIIGGHEFSDTVEDIMTREFISLRHDTLGLIERAKQLMIQNKIEQIPILDDNNVVVDVILWTDILGKKERTGPRKQHANQVVIMAGGRGKRLDPFTRILPKPLVPIHDKPVVELIMERFHKCGFHKFIFTLNYKKEYLKLFLKENDFPYSIDLIEEEDFLGTAGSLSLLAGKITDTFFVVNCDSLLDIDFEQVLKWHKDHRAAITVVGSHAEVKIPFGVLKMHDGTLRKIMEKPVHDVIINTGVYVMEPRVIMRVPKAKKIDMNVLIDSVARKEKVMVYPICDGWFDIGQWGEYKKFLKEISDE